MIEEPGVHETIEAGGFQVFFRPAKPGLTVSAR